MAWAVGFPGHRYLAFFHGLQKRRLHLGRGPVDLIGQHQMTEDRTGLENETLLSCFAQIDFGTGDVRGQQVRRELDAAEIGRQVPGKGFDAAGFGQPGKSFHEQVAVAKEPDQQSLGNGLLTDHGRFDPPFQIVDLREGVHAFALRIRVNHRPDRFMVDSGGDGEAAF